MADITTIAALPTTSAGVMSAENLSMLETDRVRINTDFTNVNAALATLTATTATQTTNIASNTASIAALVTADGKPQTYSLTAIAASGAIDSHTTAAYVITKSSAAAAMTLAAPTATTDDGVQIVVTSNTAKAHTITATGLLQTGAATTDVATFAAFAGASITLVAYQGKWNVISANAATLS